MALENLMIFGIDDGKPCTSANSGSDNTELCLKIFKFK